MPVLQDIIKTVEVKLPFSKGTVHIKTALTLADEEMINEAGAGDAAMVVAALITEWDFTDRNGAKLPITKENVRMLVNVDGQTIMNAFTEAKAEVMEQEEEVAEDNLPTGAFEVEKVVEDEKEEVIDAPVEKQDRSEEDPFA